MALSTPRTSGLTRRCKACVCARLVLTVEWRKRPTGTCSSVYWASGCSCSVGQLFLWNHHLMVSQCRQSWTILVDHYVRTLLATVRDHTFQENMVVDGAITQFVIRMEQQQYSKMNVVNPCLNLNRDKHGFNNLLTNTANHKPNKPQNL